MMSGSVTESPPFLGEYSLPFNPSTQVLDKKFLNELKDVTWVIKMTYAEYEDNEIYGAGFSVQDGLIMTYYQLVSDITIESIYVRRLKENGFIYKVIVEHVRLEWVGDKRIKLKTPDELLLTVCSSSTLGSLQELDDASDVNILLALQRRKLRRGEDFRFVEALIKADFWLLFMVYFLGVGSGVTVLNNLAQIGITSYVENTTILLSLFSFCDFIGRFGGGVISEHFVRSRALPKPFWMACMQLIRVLVFLLFASALKGTLYASVALPVISSGVQICIMVPTALELFGLKHFGVIFNFLSMGNPIAAFLFSGLLAGYVYDKEEARQHIGFLDAL